MRIKFRKDGTKIKKRKVWIKQKKGNESTASDGRRRRSR